MLIKPKDRVKWDRRLDYIPIISGLNNFVDLIQKRVFKKESQNEPANAYMRHINKKSNIRCWTLIMLPVFANIAFLSYDCLKKKKDRTQDSPVEASPFPIEMAAMMQDKSPLQLNELDDWKTKLEDNRAHLIDLAIKSPSLWLEFSKQMQQRLNLAIENGNLKNSDVKELTEMFLFLDKSAKDRMPVKIFAEIFPQDIRNQILLSTPRSADIVEQIKFLEQEDTAIDVLALWIDQNQVPLNSAGLTSTQIDKILPKLKYVNLKGYPQEDTARMLALTQSNRVLYLYLDNISDAGHQHLPMFTHLKTLDLAGCTNIINHKLQYLKNFTELKHLNLSKTNITSHGLQQLQELIHLEHLDLADCPAIGNNELQYLKCFTKLKYLNLSTAYIANDGLQHLQELINLEHLVLERCTKITGDGLKYLEKSTKLKHLNLCWTGITELKHLKGFTGLEYLNLANAQIKQGELQHLQELIHLEHFDLSRSHILTNDELKYLERLTKLRHLNLSFTKITELKHLEGFTNLEHLDLSYCPITNAQLSHIEGFISLEHLNLRGTQITELSAIESLIKLKHIDLGSCLISNTEFVHLKELPELCSLTAWPEITGKELEALPHLRKLKLSGDGIKLKCLKNLDLESLDLSATDITDKQFKYFKNFTKLKALNLSQCRITGNGLKHLNKSNLTLTHLYLSGCGRVTDENIKYIKGFTHLQYLDLLFCQKITDAALKYFTGLINLKALNLGGCNRITAQGCKSQLSHLIHTNIIL